MKHPAIIIFGATGDLTRRYLVPGLFRLYNKKSLPKKFSIIGFARREKTDENFRKELYEFAIKNRGLKIPRQKWEEFAKNIHYHKSDFYDDNGYKALGKKLKALGVCETIFYLATLPAHFIAVTKMIGKHKLHRACDGFSRLLVEKPFGEGLSSAKKLNKEIKKVFMEDEIFRIDHVLGKEVVQNVLVLRFMNFIFEHLWNKEHIDHVQIHYTESLGIGDRGDFFERTGTLKDMVQNHMLQMLALVAMESPKSIEPSDIHNEKVKILKAIEKITPEKVKTHIVRAQYVAGNRMKAYKSENKVSKTSDTETFVAMKLYVNNERWKNVPFYLRTGKRMPKKSTHIVVQFKETPCVLFCQLPGSKMEANKLIIRIQPQEGIQLNFNIKQAGNTYQVRNVKMDFSHKQRFGKDIPESYERLIYDVIRGDSTLFTRSDEVEIAWKIIDDIEKVWKKQTKLLTYTAGSEGPKEAQELIEKDGRAWVWP